MSDLASPESENCTKTCYYPYIVSGSEIPIPIKPSMDFSQEPS